ncbi:MAG: adhesin [Frankiales bacterium]|jgi:iron-sulfur cluster assembly protein|nr:adhesin [Frankiales bacterium]
MLTLTEKAAQMIRHLASRAELPAGAGLRIAQREDHPSLAMSLAVEPEPYDEVLVEHDSAVFLGPRAARRLATKTLDAKADAHGSAFFLRP